MKSVSESLAGRPDIAGLGTPSFHQIPAALQHTALEAAIVGAGFQSCMPMLTSTMRPSPTPVWLPTWNATCDHWPTLAILEGAIERYPNVRHLLVTCNRRGRMTQICERAP